MANEEKIDCDKDPVVRDAQSGCERAERERQCKEVNHEKPDHEKVEKACKD